MQQSIAQQREVASLEEDQRVMEFLARRRADLQQALEEQQQGNITEDKCWMGTNKASFFLVDKESALQEIQKEIDTVEEELRVVCGNIMKATQEQQTSS